MLRTLATPVRSEVDRGAVTVEAAISLGAFLVVVVLVFAGITASIDQIRCTDAAREAARLVARGEANRATDAVRRIAPDGATVAVGRHGTEITVEVRADSVADILPGVEVAARAFAVAEPAAAAPVTAPPTAPPTDRSAAPVGGADR